MPSFFECSVCSYQSTKWQGKCPGCNTWNSLEENKTVPAKKTQNAGVAIRSLATLASVEVTKSLRFATGSTELDRVLGGGLFQQSVVLISGEPGIGKSTLLLQLAVKVSRAESKVGNVLYICAEESPEQIKLRAERMNLDSDLLHLSAEYRVEKIEQYIQKLKPQILIIDSIQALRVESLGLNTGSISQLRACISSCYEWSQQYSCSVVIVAHITKDGAIAGPKLIEHMVDTVLVFENNKSNLRFLYSRKNRFGAIDEVGVFKMTAQGLEEIDDASIYFLEERKDEWPTGICISTAYEGTRPFLIELQALTVSVFSNNRVFSEIINSNQVFKIAAILERHVGITLSNQNMYINTAGGIKIQESGIELAVALALYSAYCNKALPVNCCAMGEISLAGEVRAVQNFEQRCKQAEEFGIRTILVPARNLKKSDFISTYSTLVPVNTIHDAVKEIEKE